MLSIEAKQIPLLILTLLAIISLSYCGGGGGSTQISDELITKNPEKPLNGSWDFKLEKEWEIENAGDEVIAKVQSLAISDSGDVIVLDPKSFRLHVVNSKGNIISSFGKKGEGPGEIKRIRANLSATNQLHILDNIIIVVDMGKIHYYSLNGKFIKDISYPAYMIPRAIVGLQSFVSGPEVADNRGQKMILYSFNPKSKKTILNYNIYQEAKGKPKKSRPIVADGITPMMIVSSRNNRIYYGMNGKYEIIVLNQAGEQTGGFSIPDRKKEPVSEKFIQWLKDLFKDKSPEKIQYYLNALPDYSCFFDQIFADVNGFVYVFIVNLDEDNKKSCDIFDPDGRYVYKADFEIEEGFEINRFHLKDEHLVLAVLDKEGNSKIIKYTVKIPALRL